MRGRRITGSKARGTIGWFACLVVFLALVGALHATTVTSDSGNTVVDTRTNPLALTVTMRRARSPVASVLENIGPGAGIDEELRVSGVNRAALAQQPSLPGQMNPSALDLARGGLVADGVTPLIFQVDVAGGLPAGGTQYTVTLKPVRNGIFNPIGLQVYNGNLDSRLQVLSGNSFVSGTSFTVTPQQPQTFLVLRPIDPANLTSSASSGLVPLKAGELVDLEIRELATSEKVATFRFGIRKPPVVLVHGYNADETTWGISFKARLGRDRGEDFVHPISYGTGSDASGRQINTFSRLRELVGVLDRELSQQVAVNHVTAPWAENWAFTRYDVIGHSQGGVLTRLLCSTPAPLTPSFVPFKSPGNLHRGRFRRVVTIGSPHVRSTMCELGLKLHDSGIDWGAFLVRFGETTGRVDPEVLFQKKFKVGNGSELQGLNSDLPCHQDARIHLMWTTVDNGQVPGHQGIDHLFYRALYLDNSTPEVASLTPGQIVALNGSDGVVSAESQGRNWPAPNHSSTVVGDFCHAVWGSTQTESNATAARALELLNGPASEFGRVEIPTNVTAAMETARGRIETLAPLIVAAHHRQEPTSSVFLNAAVPFKNALPPPIVANALGDVTLNFILDALVDEPAAGAATWLAENYGPDGVTSVGLTLTASGSNASQLALTVAASVQGTVILRVGYPSATGKTVFGQPTVVLTRPPGAAITGIELRPATVASPYGTKVPLEVWEIYDGAIASRAYVTAANTVFGTANPAVATVDADGIATMLTPGIATVTTTYENQWSTQRVITVLDDPPTVTNSTTVPATVGQSFTFQLSASQSVQTFLLDALPSGLTLNGHTGQIAGTPTTEGRFPVVVTAQNANGTSMKEMAFVIAGPVGTPTDVGLDAGGVSEGKPAGTLVGRLVTIDPNPLDTFTYQLVAGTGATNNVSFTIAGDQVFTAAVLNRAVTPTVSVRVRTTDSSGATFEKAIVLPVMAPPAITRQPDPRRVFAGDPVVFAVEASGLEPLAFQWKKNGANLAGANSRILDLGGVDPSQAGNYSATVSNGDGTAASVAAGLIVDAVSFGKWVSQFPSMAGGAGAFEPAGDYNQDGVANFLEFAAGTTSGVAALPVIRRDAAGLIFTYREANGVEPLIYEILQSTDLAVWTLYQSATGNVSRLNKGAHTEVNVRVPSTNPNLYLKLRVSTVTNADANGDGLPDAWQIANWGTTAGHGPMDDFDRDGVVELLELAFGGDPKTPDAANLPTAVNEGGYLTVTLTKRPGVTFLVETAPDLQAASWSAANTTVLIENSITLKVRDNVLIGGATARYLRVRVTVP